MFKKLLTLIAVFTTILSMAQGVTDRPALKVDSSKISIYPYVFPIMGQKVQNLGFNLPKPHGVMLNTIFGRQNLELNNLQVGFNDSPLINLDSIISFDQVEVLATTVNMRIDTWVLPFLDLYAIGGYNYANTSIKIIEPFIIETNPTTNGAYLGLGATLAGGTGPMFWSFDGNHVWTFSDKLQKPATLVTLGARAGPIWRFKNKPEQNFVLWTGFLYSKLNSETVGIISFTDVFPDAGSGVDDLQGRLDEWYEGLKDWEQVAYEGIYNRVSQGLDDVSDIVDDATIRYEMEKSIVRPVNLIIGAQWQISPEWQLRGEAQIFGDRYIGLLSINYRFGLKGHNLFSN